MGGDAVVAAGRARVRKPPFGVETLTRKLGPGSSSALQLLSGVELLPLPDLLSVYAGSLFALFGV